MKKWIGGSVLVLLLLGYGYYFLGTEIEKGKVPVADGSNDYLIVLGAKIKPSGIPSLGILIIPY